MMITKLDDANWEEFIDCPLSVMMVTESGCKHCEAWKKELTEFLEQGDVGDKVRFGFVDLKGEKMEGFKETNKEWLDLVDGIPFNAIYVDGEPQNSFYGGGVERMMNRLKRYNKL